ncbi:hypothetical protein CCX46_14155 [Pseudomonas sp. RU47]|uniref:YVTN family beta-propeller repeat protein n=1 Tax=Pseudomonas sp. RU47 TaxID=2005388 RepID=UPI000FDEBE67|nr:YncE family protein [Pseudomonas sp. RU47]AZZ76244.1 hypothetical protein CCX46_14155 [Pseudomonas sp. RU47]
MSDNDPSNNAPRLLKELDIPGRTGPVSPTPLIWGINRGALLDNFPRQGLLCRAGPWGTMGLRDSLRILRDADVQIGLEIVDKDEVDTELQMFVEAKHLPEGMHAISYAVTRLGGTPEHSEVMQVLVKLTLPGGPDHSEGPGHPELVMRIPEEILKDGVHQDNIGTGISIALGKADGSPPYPFAAAGDMPQFSWGGVFVSGPALTQEQAEGKTPVIVTIPKETIVDAGDSGEAGLAVAFEVYDLVHNRSDGWSVEQRVVVTLDETRLGAPLLKEALNNVLDVDKLGDANGTVQVMAVNPSPPRPIDFEVGDTIFVRIKGTPKEGPPIDIELPAKVLISVPSVPEITVSNAVLRQLAQAQIALSYRLKKADGSAQRNAKTQFISAIGEIHRLAAPVALEAKQGAIDPLDPDLKQVTIEIAFDPAFDVGQAIKLFWLGTRPDLSTYLPNLNLRPITQGDMDAQLPLQIIVDKQHLTPIIGGKLELYYQLLIDDSVLATMSKLNQTHAIRESIHADILQIGEPRKELPEPTVDGVVNGALPADTSSTTLTVNYLKTFKDDIVTRFWEGSITGVNNDWVKLSAITAGQPVPFTIKAELIKGNEGGTVKAYYQIERAAGGTSYSDTLEFSVGVALENPLPLPQMPEATGNGASVTLAPLDTQAGARVIVAYIGMNEKHNIKLTMAGTPGVGSPDIPAKPGVASGSVEFLIPATAIAANIGNETKTFTLSYEVTAGQTTPSLPLTVSVTPLPATELDKISIEQAEGTVLDLSKVTLGATILAGVWAFIAANHRVGLNLKGTKNNGDAFHHVVWPWPSSYVNQNWFNSGQYTHTLAYNAIKDLADGSRLELHFKAALTLSREEAEAIDAPVKVYTIKALDLAAPHIKEASNDTLNPLDAQTSLTAIVDYVGMLTGDKITVTWAGGENTPADGTHTTEPWPVTTVGQQNIPLLKSVVAFNLGKPVVVSYTVTRGSSEPMSSLTLRLTVQSLQQKDLPRPEIDGAIGDKLDVRSLTGTENLRVTAWPFQLSGQNVWLRYDSTHENGTPAEHIVWVGSPHHYTDGLTYLAPMDWLRALKDGSALTVTFRVNFDKVASDATAVNFPVRTYTVSAVQYGVPSFTNAPYTIAPSGRLKNIELLLVSSDESPMPGSKLSLVLPEGFTYADGGSGERDFITDGFGRLSVGGVKGTGSPGGYSLSATHGTQDANASVTVTELGPVGTVRIEGSPNGIAISPDGTRAYVCNQIYPAVVSMIDTATNIALNIPTEDSSNGVAFNPDGSRAYVCHGRLDIISVIDTATHQVLARIPVGHHPYWLAVSPDGSRVYVSNYSSNTVSVIDTTTDRVLASIPVGSGPRGIAVSPDGTRAYVPNYVSSTVSVIDTATNRVQTNIPVGRYPYWIAFNPDNTRAYVSCDADGTVDVIDTATDQVLINIRTGSPLRGIAVSPNGTRAYACNYNINEVSVIDTATNQVLTSIPAGFQPQYIAISPDGTRVYVINGLMNTLSVIEV